MKYFKKYASPILHASDMDVTVVTVSSASLASKLIHKLHMPVRLIGRFSNKIAFLAHCHHSSACSTQLLCVRCPQLAQESM